jgi:hypothetical protein
MDERPLCVCVDFGLYGRKGASSNRREAYASVSLRAPVEYLRLQASILLSDYDQSALYNRAM